MSNYTLPKLQKKLIENTDYKINLENDVLVITNDCDINAVLAISGEQILIETLLHPVSKTKDTNELNEKILSSHHLMPLTNICISDHGDEKYYTAFGSVYSGSKFKSIQMEVDMLFSNTEEISQALESYFA